MNRSTIASLVLIGLAIIPVAGTAYVRGRVGFDGPFFSRADAANIQFVINDQVAAGMLNADGAVLITPGSDPVGAANSAIATLNGLQDADFQFAPLQVTGTQPASGDGINSISFSDTSPIRSMVGGALGIALFNFNPANGSITEGDIFMNPDVLRDGDPNPFATTGEEGASDIESTLLHELIHSLGAGHSNVLGATMYQSGRQGETFARTPAADDIAYVVDTYPASGAATRFGRIQGTATFTHGGPIRNGAIAAVDTGSGTVIGGLTEADGTYDVLVPPSASGDGYVVYAEPLDGPVFPGNVNRPNNLADTEFQVAFAAGAAPGGGVPITGGQVVTLDIEAQAGPPVVDILSLSFPPQSGAFQFGSGPILVPDGTAMDLVLWGQGLDQIQPGDLQILNPAFGVRQNTVGVDALFPQVNGLPAIRATLDIFEPGGPTQNAPDSDLGTLVISIGGATTAYTGALVLDIEPQAGPTPAISSGGIVLATLLPTVSTISPLSIISVFGQDFSTETILFPTLDGDGNLDTILGGTCLMMNGEALPIFAVTPGQINAQASASEVLGPASFTVVTDCGTANALASEAVTLSPTTRGASATPQALTSNVEMATVEQATPGFFLFPPLANDGLIAARFNSDNAAVAPAGMFNDQFGPSRPAKPGDIIVLYGTGWGPTTAGLEAGELAIRVPANAQSGDNQVVLNAYGTSTPVGPVVPVEIP